jgi:hypothetical protein
VVATGHLNLERRLLSVIASRSAGGSKSFARSSRYSENARYGLSSPRRWKWEVGKFFAGVGPGSPAEEIAGIAHDHRIFRIEP